MLMISDVEDGDSALTTATMRQCPDETSKEERVVVVNTSSRVSGPVAPSNSELFQFVRFSDAHDICWIPTCREMEPDEIQTLWYSQQDFDRFKAKGRIEAKETRLEGKHITFPVDHAYAKCQAMGGSFQEDELLLSSYLMHGNNNMEELKQRAADLCVWAQRKETCRGLEHWISKSYFASRLQIKNHLRAAVVVKDDPNSHSISPEQLAINCQIRSRPCRILARLMGLADSQFKTNLNKYPELAERILQDYRKLKQQQGFNLGKTDSKDVSSSNMELQQFRNSTRALFRKKEMAKPSKDAIRTSGMA